MATTASIDQNIDGVRGYKGRQAWATLTTANTAKDGTGTVATIFTAATNGSEFQFIRFRSLGTNVASVARIFLNNGGSNATPTNNSLIDEVSLPATTLTEIAAQNQISITLPIKLLDTHRINVVIGTTVAAGWQVTGFGDDL